MVATHTRSRAWGRTCLLTTLGLLAAVLPPAAYAGSYTVTGCDSSGRVDGWVPSSTPGYGAAYGAGCPGYPGAGGLLARSVGRADKSLAPVGSYAAWTFWAPAGTRVVGFSAYYTGFSKYPWVPGIRDPDSGRWINCSLACPILFPNWSYLSYSGLSQRGIGILTICWAGGCRGDADNSGRAQLSHTSVVLADDQPPAVSITGGTLVAGSWRHGTQTLSYAAQDNTGIRTVRTLVDGQSVGRADLACDPHAVVPCRNTSATMNVDTSVLFRQDGDHTITVEATDGGYNVASATRHVLVDNTAPNQPSSLVASAARAWTSVNRFGASWTLPPNQGSPIAGAAYELCTTAQPRTCVRGERGGADLSAISDLAVPGDGSWMLRLWLRDQAGNEDPNRSMLAGPLGLDRVPPDVQLRPRDSEDPTRLVVQASDASSGVSSMEIEIHRRGSAAWRGLPVVRDGSRFSAIVDDEVLAPGVYDIRARATDAAGNERTAAVDSGAPARIQLPVRIASTLRVGRPVGNRRHHRLDRTVTTPHNSPTLLHGRLTAPGGNPVQGADVQVRQKSTLPGSEFSLLGGVRTTRDGAFRFRIPSGTSRIVRFRYPGTRRQRGATTDVHIGVPASTTIDARPRVAVNGEYVTFRGRLQGRPMPPGGKLVELQVFTRRRWRTFAQPRADATTGRWQFAYRFEAVSGRVVFRFRARIRKEALYPYELGRSRSVSVRVVGL
jgi:hypothetical protein